MHFPNATHHDNVGDQHANETVISKWNSRWKWLKHVRTERKKTDSGGKAIWECYVGMKYLLLLCTGESEGGSRVLGDRIVAFAGTAPCTVVDRRGRCVLVHYRAFGFDSFFFPINNQSITRSWIVIKRSRSGLRFFIFLHNSRRCTYS